MIKRREEAILERVEKKAEKNNVIGIIVKLEICKEEIASMR